ncbi:MAG: hypothetical protein H0T50_05785 [Gemmatimonadales bacterium]|nr:hypothetical protein [Gemmatimonadales bacterium]
MNPTLSTSPRVTYLVLALLAAASPVGAQQRGGTIAQGAPDPCALVTEAEAGAIAGVPMQHHPMPARTELRNCVYLVKAPSGKNVTGLLVTTYQSIADPSALVQQGKTDCGKANFKHESDLGPLTASCVDPEAAQVMGFKGRTGLMVQLGGSSPELHSLARRGFGMAMKKLP